MHKSSHTRNVRLPLITRLGPDSSCSAVFYWIVKVSFFHTLAVLEQLTLESTDCKLGICIPSFVQAGGAVFGTGTYCSVCLCYPNSYPDPANPTRCLCAKGWEMIGGRCERVYCLSFGTLLFMGSYVSYKSLYLR
jgi:hypothetical protein